jgi:hypothetical protein
MNWEGTAFADGIGIAAKGTCVCANYDAVNGSVSAWMSDRGDGCVVRAWSKAYCKGSFVEVGNGTCVSTGYGAVSLEC